MKSMNLEVGSPSYKLAAEAYERATGAPPAELVTWSPEGLTCPMDRFNAPAVAAHRAEHSHPCAVPWCGRPAVWSWQRTTAELRDIYRGKRWADTRESWETVREVCDVHRPRWRADVYVPLGQVRAAAPAPAVKRPARKVAPAAVKRPARKVAPAEDRGPAVAALLKELADTRAMADKYSAHLEHKARHTVGIVAELADVRAQLEAARAQLAQHSETWAALAARAEELRQAREELADLRATLAAPAAPADILAELVA